MALISSEVVLLDGAGCRGFGAGCNELLDL